MLVDALEMDGRESKAGFHGCDGAVAAMESREPGRSAARRCLNVIDECLNVLEELHLRGRYLAGSRGCQQVIDLVVTRAGAQPTDEVAAARTSYALHAALLNWQSSVLDQLIVYRHQRFPDLDQDSEQWTIPRLRRRRRQA